MNTVDIILLILIGAAVIAAVRTCIKNRKKGGCCGNCEMCRGCRR